MMILFFLLGGLFWAFTFGRNNFSNIFGSAVGTGVLSLKSASFLTAMFLLLGGVLNGSETSQTLSSFIHFVTAWDVFFFSMIITFMMLLLTKWGIPASISQLCVGALVGWNLALKAVIPWKTVAEMIVGWFISPIVAFLLALFLFKGVRFYLRYVSVPILERDIWVRLLWCVVGSFTAYSLGANNLPVLTTPFTGFVSDSFSIFVLFSVAVCLGCLMASQRVIRKMSSDLFPLSSVESLIVGFSGALTLLFFSFQNRFFSALPISISAALVGAIIGVSCAKGGYGLKNRALFAIMASWIWAPFFSGLFCFVFVAILQAGGN